jgi:hypothetical protein
MTEISSTDLAVVTGGAEPQQTWAQSAWQGFKDVTGGAVAGAWSGRREDQPWGNSSSQMSKLGGELGTMATMGMGQRNPFRRR